MLMRVSVGIHRDDTEAAIEVGRQGYHKDPEHMVSHH